MEPQDNSSESRQQEAKNEARDLRTYCLLCWRVIDLDLDRRGKPYAYCGGCGTRVFMSRTTLDALKSQGLAWSEEPPIEVIRRWLDKAAAAVGLSGDKKEE